MAKLSKDFFPVKEVVFIGYSSRNPAYSKEIFQAFTKNGFTVYLVNSKDGASYDVKVYKSLAELPAIPETAFVLMNKGKSAEIVKELADSGIKRILFRAAEPATLEKCKELGIETAIGCPLMLLGSGMHRFHGFLAGVKR